MFNYIAIAIATASLMVGAGNVNQLKKADVATNETTAISAQNPVTLAIREPIEQTVKKTYKLWITAYTSRPEETDDTPFITASGDYVRDGIVAANFLPMGTRIRIPAYSGDKVFVVDDRMNSRYFMNVDIWFKDLADAKHFGKRYLTIEVL